MFWMLFGLLLLVPVVELYVIAQVAGQVGLLEALLLLVAISLAGAWLVKREGLGLLRRVRDQLDRGQIPTNDLVDGLLLLVAGSLMLVPGFVTDVVGLLLLVPFVRAPLRTVLLGRFRRRLDLYTFVGPATAGASFDVYDVEVVRERPAPRDPRSSSPPELGP